MVKNFPASAGGIRDIGLIPGTEWQLTPVFLSGESHGQRSLAGYSPQGHKESDMTGATTHTHTHTHTSTHPTTSEAISLGCTHFLKSC